MHIIDLVRIAHANAEAHGFWDEERELGTLLMLIVSELGEALEAHRKGDMKNFAEELADVAIRLGDLCGGLDIDLEWEIIQKMEYNQTRPRLHGKAY